MTTVIRGGYVLNPEGTGFEKRDLFVRDDKIADGNVCADQTIEADGLFVLPGMIDIHTHGFCGASYAVSGQDWSEARRRLAGCGVTAILPTVRTMALDRIVEAEKEVLGQPRRMPDGAAFAGIHLEGPFISKDKTGAMTAVDAECGTDNFMKLYDAAGGLLKIMTIAPERENAREVIAKGVGLGVRMSMGHTMAVCAEALAGFDAGVTGATHLYNAMRGFEHREPGALGAALADQRVSCELIADFVHSDRTAVMLAYRAKGCEKLILVSDSGEMTGLGDGVYYVDGKTRIVKDGVCRNEQGRLAGSTLTIYDDAKNMLSLGVPLEEVARMTSKNPAEAAGIGDLYGSLAPGRYADLLLCGEQLELKKVMIGGRIIKE